jgi:hypothetical protein
MISAAATFIAFPVAGIGAALVRARFGANSRRAERRLEKYRLEKQADLTAAQTTGRERAEITKIMETHGATDRLWFQYEIDVAKLLDFPMMTDMRAPLTLAFHKAKREADLLRPETADSLLGDKDGVGRYRAAVHEYVKAFEIAEAEAIRRRRSDFSEDEQQRMQRAQRLLNLAQDEGATSDERRSAYEKATKELEGLLVLPAPARAAIEHRIVAQLEA